MANHSGWPFTYGLRDRNLIPTLITCLPSPFLTAKSYKPELKLWGAVHEIPGQIKRSEINRPACEIQQGEIPVIPAPCFHPNGKLIFFRCVRINRELLLQFLTHCWCGRNGDLKVYFGCISTSVSHFNRHGICVLINGIYLNGTFCPCSSRDTMKLEDSLRQRTIVPHRGLRPLPGIPRIALHTNDVSANVNNGGCTRNGCPHTRTAIYILTNGDT